MFLSVPPLLEPAVPAHFGHYSEGIRTPFRTPSDTDPNHFGHHSDGTLKLSDIRPEHCPNSIGMVSGLNRNTVRSHVGTVSEMRRNTHTAEFG
jgi:hypothetical protein